MNNKIYLASLSPRRSSILEQFKIEYTLAPPISDVVEETINGSPKDTVIKNAQKKALAAISSKSEFGLYLGFDTIVCVDDVILGKPKTKIEAKDMINSLSGKKHQVYTGVYGVSTDKSFVQESSAITEVTFRQLSKTEINNYIISGESMDKAGSYGIQGMGGSLIDKINGCYYNVVGLPVKETIEIIKNFGKIK